MHRPPYKASIDELFSKQAFIQNIKCIQINSIRNDQSLTLCSYNEDATRALVVSCPDGGITFQMRKGWFQESSAVHVKTETEHHEIARSLVMVAKQCDWTFGALTLISDRIRMQSSVHPFDIHSFCTQKNGLTLRCPKGGVSISCGTGGIRHNTSGNIEYNLDTDRSQVRIASRGTKQHTILLGNANTETIVENQLTIRGKLVLSDDSVVEKHVSVVHELQNVVELACQSGASTATFDYGLVAKQKDKKSGMIFDHARNLFYFSTHLGTYQQNRFALPKQYADVQGRTLIAQQKVSSPFVEAHAVQCRSVRCGRDNVLMLQSPLVQCSQKLMCGSVQSELTSTVRAKANSISTNELEVAKTANVRHLQTDHLTVQGNLQMDKLLFNTIGPNSRHRTLQDYFDAADDIRAKATAAASYTESTHHAILEASNNAHNCNAIVNYAKCHINGQHSLLTGVIEITEECESFVLNDARVSQFTLTSTPEYKRDKARPATIVLRNVHGDVKDWCFDMPETVLRLEFCNLTFQNNVLGTLKKVETLFSNIIGEPWRMIEIDGG